MPNVIHFSKFIDKKGKQNHKYKFQSQPYDRMKALKMMRNNSFIFAENGHNEAGDDLLAFFVFKNATGALLMDFAHAIFPLRRWER